MITVKRTANVGERVLVTNAEITFGRYENGDEFTAEIVIDGSKSELDGIYVEELELKLFHNEYEVIINDN